MMHRFRFTGLTMRMVKMCNRSYSPFDFGSGEPTVPWTKINILSNGMRVATEESNSPVACVALFVAVGPVYEQPINYGITHFIEYMAYRGFRTMDQERLEENLANIGAEMTVKTTREFQVFSAKCPTANVSDIVSILSKIVTELEMSQDAIEKAKAMLELESLETDNNPKVIVSDFLHETAFQGTPLGRRVMGPSKNINKFNKHVIESYMQQFYYPARFVLATSGAVNHNNMVCSAEACFSHIKASSAVPYCPPQRFTGSQVAYRDDSMPFVHVAIAVEAPGYRSADYLTMLLASYIIGSWSKTQGGTNRHAAVLAKAAATSDLCDNFESFYIPYGDVGLWGIYMVTELMSIEDMIANVQDRWMHLCTTTLSNDVERGVNTMKLEVAKSIEGSVKSCHDIGTQILYKSERTSLPEIYCALSKVDAKTIKKVVGGYLYDRCPVVAAVGPTEAIPDYTRLRAGMYWLRF